MSNSSNGESIFKELIDTIAGITGIPWVWEGYTPYRGFLKLDTAVSKQYVGVYQMEKIEVTVFLESGQLKIEFGKDEPKPNLYAAKKDHFFIKGNPLELQFERGSAGNVEKMIAIDGKERHELKKIK